MKKVHFIKVLGFALVLAIVSLFNFSKLEILPSNDITVSSLVSTAQAQTEDENGMECRWYTTCVYIDEADPGYWDCTTDYSDCD